MSDEPKLTEQEAREKFPKVTTKSFLASFPPHLKDPANYEKIQTAIIDTIKTKHSHATTLEWMGCKPCTRKRDDYKTMILSLGFLSIAHYMTWRKIHHEIKRRMPLI